ncbi:Sporulation protein RMD1 [Porphyridium purpureum]|uniref:Sporulation protein RMD1 n=1 Tax=Porphyridium purpureum TaxID=35688 RepID=A0A5J4Z057_PORPP|nr:Sporulation protein RMD1 [Porphyridium purpureum]|eukprot:POR9154..scf208_2
MDETRTLLGDGSGENPTADGMPSSYSAVSALEDRSLSAPAAAVGGVVPHALPPPAHGLHARAPASWLPSAAGGPVASGPHLQQATKSGSFSSGKFTAPMASSVARAPQLAGALASSRFVAGSKTRLDRIRPSQLVRPGEDKSGRWTGRLSVFCTCNTFLMKELFQEFANKSGWVMRRFSREVLHGQWNWDAGTDAQRNVPFFAGQAGEFAFDTVSKSAEIFIFDYGVIVMWALPEVWEWQVLESLKPFENGRLEYGIEMETYDFTYLEPRTQPESDAHAPSVLFRIEHDVFWLSSDLTSEDLLHVKLACSYGVAQSEKLASFESAVESIFRRIEPYPVQLARTGVLHLTDRELLMMSGELYTYSAYINLQTDVLDEVPAWFWDNISFEPVYERAHKYLDCKARVTVLNKRLSVIESMYALFRDERHISYGHRLEWIVIWLIAVEAVLEIITIYIEFFHKF